MALILEPTPFKADIETPRHSELTYDTCVEVGFEVVAVLDVLLQRPLPKALRKRVQEARVSMYEQIEPYSGDFAVH
jgi:hypothetical protein